MSPDRFDRLFTSPDRSERLLSEIFKAHACPLPKEDALEIIKVVLTAYDARSVDMLLLRYRDGLKYIKIAQKYGLSTSRIKQIEDQTFTHIRQVINSRKYEVDSTAQTSLDTSIDCLLRPSNCGTIQLNVPTISVGAFNILWRAGVRTIRDIVKTGPYGLTKIHNRVYNALIQAGVKSVRSVDPTVYAEIVSCLVLRFGEKADDWCNDTIDTVYQDACKLIFFGKENCTMEEKKGESQVEMQT